MRNPFSRAVAYVVHLKKFKKYTTHPKIKTRNPSPAAPTPSLASVDPTSTGRPSSPSPRNLRPSGSIEEHEGARQERHQDPCGWGPSPLPPKFDHLYRRCPSPWLTDPPRDLRPSGSKKMRERGRRSDGIYAIRGQAHHRRSLPQPSSMPSSPEPFA